MSRGEVSGFSSTLASKSAPSASRSFMVLKQIGKSVVHDACCISSVLPLALRWFTLKSVGVFLRSHLANGPVFGFWTAKSRNVFPSNDSTPRPTSVWSTRMRIVSARWETELSSGDAAVSKCRTVVMTQDEDPKAECRADLSRRMPQNFKN